MNYHVGYISGLGYLQWNGIMHIYYLVQLAADFACILLIFFFFGFMVLGLAYVMAIIGKYNAYLLLYITK